MTDVQTPPVHKQADITSTAPTGQSSPKLNRLDAGEAKNKQDRRISDENAEPKVAVTPPADTKTRGTQGYAKDEARSLFGDITNKSQSYSDSAKYPGTQAKEQGNLEKDRGNKRMERNEDQENILKNFDNYKKEIKDKAEDFSKQAKNKFSQIKEAGKEDIENLGFQIRSSLDSIKGKGENLKKDVKETAEDLTRKGKDKLNQFREANRDEGRKKSGSEGTSKEFSGRRLDSIKDEGRNKIEPSANPNLEGLSQDEKVSLKREGNDKYQNTERYRPEIGKMRSKDKAEKDRTGEPVYLSEDIDYHKRRQWKDPGTDVYGREQFDEGRDRYDYRPPAVRDLYKDQSDTHRDEGLNYDLSKRTQDRFKFDRNRDQLSERVEQRQREEGSDIGDRFRVDDKARPDVKGIGDLPGAQDSTQMTRDSQKKASPDRAWDEPARGYDFNMDKSKRDEGKDRFENIKKEAKDTAQSFADQAKNKFEQIKDQPGQYTEQFRTKFDQFKDEAREKAQDYANQARDKFERYKDEVRDKFESERQSMEGKARDTFEKTKDEVKDKAQTFAGQAKEKANQLLNEGKNKANEFISEGKEKTNLSREKAENLKDEIKGKTQQFGDQAKGKFESVKDNIKGSLKQDTSQPDRKLDEGPVKDKLEELKDKAKERAEQYASQANKRLDELKDKPKEQHAESPKPQQQARTTTSDAKNKFENVKDQAKERFNEAKREGREKLEDLKQKSDQFKREAQENINTAKHEGEDAIDSLKATAEVVKNEVVQKAEELLKTTAPDLVKPENIETAKGYVNDISESFRSFIDNGPNALTQFKRNYVFPINKDVRMLAHGGFTLLFFLANLKFRRGLIGSVRNTAIVGLLTGIVFNPEMFNPFLVRATTPATATNVNTTAPNKEGSQQYTKK